MPAALKLTLTDTALAALHVLLKQRDVVPSVRTRLLALLYLHQGKSARQIELMGLMDSRTASRARQEYERGGFAALDDRPRPGRTSVYTPEMRERTLELLRHNDRTWNCTTLLDVLHDEFGLMLDTETLRQHLHAMGVSWQRTRLIVPAMPNPYREAEMRDDLDTLKKGRSRVS